MRLLRLIAALVTVLAGLAAASTSQANTFTMVSCAAGQLFEVPWSGERTPLMRTSRDCVDGSGLLLTANVFSPSTVPYASDAKWRLQLPGGLRIKRVRGAIRLNQGAGWAAGFFAEDRGNWIYGGPSCLGQCGNGVFTTFDFGIDSRDLSLVMLCYAASCAPGMSTAMTGVEVTIDDPTRPQVALTGGSLANGAWARGDASVSYRASDDSGVQRVEVFVDGERKIWRDSICDRVVLPGCQSTVEDSATLPTRLFNGDGAHRLVVRATDFSGNVGEQSTTVRADNTAPVPPVALSTVGSQWQSSDRVAVRWTNPKQSSGTAPIAGATSRLCRVDGSSCATGTRSGSELAAIDDLRIPAPGLWRLQLALNDAAGNVDLANAAELTVGFDNTPPNVGIVPTNPEDPTHLQVAASDDTSPITRGEVEMQRRGSKTWRAVPTRITSTGLEATIDDEVLASGDYNVRAHAWNAAGLERSTDNWTTGQAALLTLPLRIATRVRLGAAKRRSGSPRARTVLVRRPVINYGRRVRLTGQLVAPGGNALVSVPVQVSSRIEMPNAAWRPVAELRTDRTGHFRYLVPRGPSRAIRFRYAGTAMIRSITRDVPVRVRASSSITVSRHSVVNGDAVRFRGKIRGGHLPSGKRVELQFFARGKWRTFASTRANRRARWGYTYRFDGSRGTVRWKFRALITPEAGYPYTTGNSRPVRVTVRGLP